MLRFILGVKIPMASAFKATGNPAFAGARGDDRLSNKATTAFFVRYELLPVTNYQVDADALKSSGIPVFVVVGEESLRQRRFYAETLRPRGRNVSAARST